MLEDVEFRTSRFAPEIARILALEGGGQRPMPLVHTGSFVPEAREAVKQVAVPEAVRAGLYLYCSCWDEAHSTADAIEDPNGYFWHAIVHRQKRKGRRPVTLDPGRSWMHNLSGDNVSGAASPLVTRVPQKPDPGNSAYWFRRAGAHPIFPMLAAEAGVRGYLPGHAWDPFAFIRFCETAGKRPGSKEAQLAMEVQLLEWQLLFDHCARGVAC